MFPESIQKLINHLSKLPDIGPRAATRLAFHLINQDQTELNDLSSLIANIRKEINLCKDCFNLTSKDNDQCPVCQDKKRDQKTICLVETVLNIPPLEKTKRYNGLYHVLGGLISPADGIGPENLRIKELTKRIKENQPQEIIFALSPTTEGDTTALYIEHLLKDIKIKTSRLARGLSSGSDLEYADEHTLSNALMGRK